MSYEAARMGTTACDSGRYAAVLYQVGVSVRVLDAAHKPRRVDTATYITRHMQVLDSSSVSVKSSLRAGRYSVGSIYPK